MNKTNKPKDAAKAKEAWLSEASALLDVHGFPGDEGVWSNLHMLMARKYTPEQAVKALPGLLPRLVEATAAPWEINPMGPMKDPTYYCVYAPGADRRNDQIAIVDARGLTDKSQMRSNAMLIRAAPDLLAACKAMITDDWKTYLAAQKQARAAIRKATVYRYTDPEN